MTVPAFEIGQTEVTVAAYGEYLDSVGPECTNPGDGGSCFPGDLWEGCNYGEDGRQQHPVDCVTWFQAEGYCLWAGKRLCSESEWEKVAAGPDSRKYPWGPEMCEGWADSPTCKYANVEQEGGTGCGEDGKESTLPVGGRPKGASPFGALDMIGNVREWVADDWHKWCSDTPLDGGAWVEEPRSAERVVRGCNFMDPPCTSQKRHSWRAADGGHWTGFRCCRSL